MDEIVLEVPRLGARPARTHAWAGHVWGMHGDRGGRGACMMKISLGVNGEVPRLGARPAYVHAWAGHVVGHECDRGACMMKISLGVKGEVPRPGARPARTHA